MQQRPLRILGEWVRHWIFYSLYCELRFFKKNVREIDPRKMEELRIPSLLTQGFA